MKKLMTVFGTLAVFQALAPLDAQAFWGSSVLRQGCQLVLSAATLSLLGPPRNLLGLDLGPVSWRRTDDGSKMSYGRGMTKWGETEIRMDADSLEVSITPSENFRLAEGTAFNQIYSKFPEYYFSAVGEDGRISGINQSHKRVVFELDKSPKMSSKDYQFRVRKFLKFLFSELR